MKNNKDFKYVSDFLKEKFKTKKSKIILICCIVGVIIVGMIYAVISYNLILVSINKNIDEGNYSQAETILKEQLIYNKQMSSFYIAYSELYLKQNKIEDAINILEKGKNNVDDKTSLDNKISLIKSEYADYFNQIENAKNKTIQEQEVKKQTEKKEQAKIDEENQKKDNINNTLYTLFDTTKKVIINRLKAPSTAKFDSNPQLQYDEANGIYKIKSYVDAQNSFGAMLNYGFYAEYNKDLEIIYLVFDKEVLVNIK